MGVCLYCLIIDRRPSGIADRDDKDNKITRCTHGNIIRYYGLRLLFNI